MVVHDHVRNLLEKEITMTQLAITPMPTETVRALQSGHPDSYGIAPERAVSGGAGNPCRHCLQNIPEGAEMLVFAHRPFPDAQPYAETGPIFLCAAECEPYGASEMPPIAQTSPDYLLKGYSPQNRIVYGTGAVVPAKDMAEYASKVLERDDIAYVHVRSARNNCYQFRIDRT